MCINFYIYSQPPYKFNKYKYVHTYHPFHVRHANILFGRCQRFKRHKSCTQSENKQLQKTLKARLTCCYFRIFADKYTHRVIQMGKKLYTEETVVKDEFIRFIHAEVILRQLYTMYCHVTSVKFCICTVKHNFFLLEYNVKKHNLRRRENIPIIQGVF